MPLPNPLITKIPINMKRFTLLRIIMLFAGLLAVASVGWSQTNPSPQTLPYSQNFDALDSTSTIYPAGWQGWTLATAPGATFLLTPPTAADRALTASSTAATTSGNVHNYNGKIGFLNTGSLDLSVALAINTTGRTSIVVNYDIMTIRNPFGTGTPVGDRINEIILQYRVGTTGNFVNLTGTEYQNNTVTQTTAITTPQNLLPRSIILPAAADNQPVVQLRLASRQVSGVGSRPSFAIDNVVITGTDMGGPQPVATPAFSPNGGTFYAPMSVTISTATENANLFYSLVGSEGPWTAYTAPINLSATTTLWARAEKAGMLNSSVASAVFTFPAITEVASIAQLRQQAVLGTAVFRITGEVLMTYGNASRNQKYFQDPDRGAGLKIDDPSGFLTTPLQPGDGVRNLLGTLSNFNNMLQFIPIQGQSPAARSSAGNVIEALPVTLAQLINPANFFTVGALEFSNFQGLLVRVNSLKFEQTGNFNNTVSFGEVPISDPTATLAAIAAGPKGALFRVEYSDLDYNNTPIPQNLVHLTAIVDQRNNVARIFARSLADFDHNVLSNNARLQTLTLGGRDALPLSGLVVTDPVADAGATMFVSNFAGFAGIVVTPEQTGATFTVTRNGVAVPPGDLATAALQNGDVIVVRVVAENGTTVRIHKVTLQQEARSLAITLPIGGETYQTGQPVTINWTSVNVANVNLQVFLDGRPEPVAEFMDISAALGTFTQPLPNGAHGQHFFRLINAADPTHFVNSPMVTFIDNVAPKTILLIPANNSTSISLSPEFKMEIDERIWPVAGRNIRLHRASDNAIVETLASNSPRVEVLQDDIYFSFETQLAIETQYYIVIDAGAFADAANNLLPAIGENQWRFTTQSLICNGNFEAWTNDRPDCWFGVRTNLPAASITQYAPGQSGLSAVRLVRTETSHQRFTTQPTSVVRGRRYNISFWAKGQGQIRTGLFDERADAFGYFYNPYIALDSGTWQQFTQSVTADNTSSIAEFIFSVHSTNAARNHIQIDNVTITEVVVVVNQVANLSALRAGTLGEIYQVTGEVILTFQQAHRNQKFVQDAGAAIMIDDPTGLITTAYSIGDGISNIRGTLSDNNGMLILTPTADPGVRTSTGNAIVPAVRTLASLASADQARLVKIMGVRFDATGNFAGAMNYNLTSPEGAGVFRTAFPAADYIGLPIPTTPLNLTALVGQFQTTLQLTARSLADFETATALPVIPEGRVLVFPNPFSNHIRVLHLERASTVRIISSTGQVMKEYVSAEGDLEINTSSLKSGFYILQVITPGGKPIIQRLIKN